MSEAARDFKGDVRKFVTAIIRKYEGAHQKVSRMEEAKDAIQVCSHLCLVCVCFAFVVCVRVDLVVWFGLFCFGSLVVDLFL